MADSPGLFEIQDIRELEQGYGLFATQDILKGKTVLIEFPERVIRLNELDGQHDIPKDVVFGPKVSGFDEFYKARQNVIFGKSSTFFYVSLPQHPRGTYEDEEGSIADEGDIILVTPSAVNHSCTPNMFRVDSIDIDTRRLKCRFVATRDISVGEQLTITYESKILTWEQPHTRRSLLAAEFKFFCKCQKCNSECDWRELVPLAPTRAENMWQITQDETQSQVSVVITPRKKQATSPNTMEAMRRSFESTMFRLDGAERSETNRNKVRFKVKLVLWIETVSQRTKTWIKNIPEEVKATATKHRSQIKDTDIPGPMVALYDTRDEDGALLNKVFRAKVTDVEMANDDVQGTE